MEKIDWKKYLQKEISCSCGKTYFCDIEEIIIEDHAIKQLTTILARHSYKKLCVVSDNNTEKAADLRNRFGLLQILFDFHMQEVFSSNLIDEFY